MYLSNYVLDTVLCKVYLIRLSSQYSNISPPPHPSFHLISLLFHPTFILPKSLLTSHQQPLRLFNPSSLSSNLSVHPASLRWEAVQLPVAELSEEVCPERWVGATPQHAPEEPQQAPVGHLSLLSAHITVLNVNIWVTSAYIFCLPSIQTRWRRLHSRHSLQWSNGSLKK